MLRLEAAYLTLVQKTVSARQKQRPSQPPSLNSLAAAVLYPEQFQDTALHFCFTIPAGLYHSDLGTGLQSLCKAEGRGRRRILWYPQFSVSTPPPSLSPHPGVVVTKVPGTQAGRQRGVLTAWHLASPFEKRLRPISHCLLLQTLTPSSSSSWRRQAARGQTGRPRTGSSPQHKGTKLCQQLSLFWGPLALQVSSGCTFELGLRLQNRAEFSDLPLFAKKGCRMEPEAKGSGQGSQVSDFSSQSLSFVL